MKILDNVSNTVRDDLRVEIKRGSRVSIAAACFSMYAYQELKKQLESVEEFRFIFTSPTFVKEKTQKQKREFYMTDKIAMQMKAHDLPVSRDIFEAAWNCTAQEDHIELLLDYYTLLNAEELEQYFAELRAPYSELSDRSRRHEVSLPVKDKNKALAEYLKKIGYLTNWEEKTEKYFDAATECEKTRKILKLRIKQVK